MTTATRSLPALAGVDPQTFAKSGLPRGGVPLSPLDLAKRQPSTAPSLGCAVAGPVWANAHFVPLACQ